MRLEVRYYHPDLPPYCPCSDYDMKQEERWCKHLWAVIIQCSWDTEKDDPPGSDSGYDRVATRSGEAAIYGQGPAYRKARVNQREDFDRLLFELCRNLPESTSGSDGGRPKLHPADMVFAVVLKAYLNRAADSAIGDLRRAQKNGHIRDVPHFNSIYNFLSAASTSNVLYELISVASLPLRILDSQYAIDATHFKTRTYVDDEKQPSGRKRVWIKLHQFVGVRTNVVALAKIAPYDSHEINHLADMVKRAAPLVSPDEISADAGYLSADNVETIAALGAIPFIPMKSNSLGEKGGEWDKLFNWYKYRKLDWLGRYYNRNNAETTAHMIKAKFGDRIRSITEPAMSNEVLAKVLCHNICCVIDSIYQSGIVPEFWPQEDD